MSETTAQLPQWLYVLRPRKDVINAEDWTPRDIEIIGAHFRYLQELAQKGVMLVVGRTDVQMCDNLGLAIYTAATEDEARSIMLNDPVVQNGVMTATLFPYRIAILGHAVHDLATT